MKLKRYQSDTLAKLRQFFEDALVAGPKDAYEAITKEPEQAQRLGRYGGTYVPPLKELPDVPYVCLRLPTGGGKTILGAHSIGVARDAWVGRDYPMVLWLVPSNTIRLQTAEALTNAKHPYRQVLDEAFNGRVRVFDIANFTHIRPHDIRDHCCIVVGTIQTLRVTNTEGRKVYAHNENLEPHFTALPQTLPGLETLEDGGAKFSFANLMHLHRPLMIVDEAHNAVTGLTREMQTRVNPSAIIEFTATPRLKSNILHSVTAQELKQEEMIKLPIMLSEHDTWQNAVSSAIVKRAALASTAENDPDYIRPIVLFQAQKKNQEVTVEVLKNHLMEVERIPEEKIAVATGDQRELDGVNLFDPNCPIEHVITVEALKEGWDCSFAYAFCSVSRIQSAVDVEQLLGRVLRMPYAKRRKAVELNRAYAFLSEPSAGKAAQSLADKLVSMGFEEYEAQENIEQIQETLSTDTGLFGERERPFLTITCAAIENPEAIAELEKHESVTVNTTEDGKAEIAIASPIDKPLERMLVNALPKEDREDLLNTIAQNHAAWEKRLSPAERGETFEVPRLMSVIQDELVFADTDLFMEYHEWSPFDHPPKLDESEFTMRETARGFEIDLDGNHITYHLTDEQEQLTMNVNVEGWTPEALAIWLDRAVYQSDIHQRELLRWLRELVGYLVDKRGMPIAALMRHKYILARKIREKLDEIRQQARNNAYQQYLFTPEAKVEVSFNHTFVFEEGMYWDQRPYRGRRKFNKHFLSQVPAFDGKEDGEEYQCALIIDNLPNMKYWIRNVARHQKSFWLTTSTDKFYPDFVAQLEDGRQLIVEYKGAHIADNRDTAEKRTIGQLWEDNSEGRGLFIVVENTVDGKNMEQQLKEKIGEKP